MRKYRSPEWRDAIMALDDWWYLTGILTEDIALVGKEDVADFDSAELRSMTLGVIDRIGATGCMIDPVAIWEFYSRILAVYEPTHFLAMPGTEAELYAAKQKVYWFIGTCNAFAALRINSSDAERVSVQRPPETYLGILLDHDNRTISRQGFDLKVDLYKASLLWEWFKALLEKRGGPLTANDRSNLSGEDSLDAHKQVARRLRGEVQILGLTVREFCLQSLGDTEITFR